MRDLPAPFPLARNSVKIPVFTPQEVIEVPTGPDPEDAWTPDGKYRVFMPVEDITLTFTPAGGIEQAAVLWPSFVAFGISDGMIFNFTDNGNNLIIVM